MEGWNDCPPVISRPPVGKRKVSRSRRVGIPTTYSETDTKATETAISSVNFGSTDSLASSLKSQSSQKVDLDTEGLQTLYERSSLTEKDLDICRRRIEALQGHEIFINDVIRRLLSELAATITRSILDYMTVKENVGPGCLALRKLVESI